MAKEITTAQLQGAIKRLNQRLVQLDKDDLKGSYAHSQMEYLARRLGTGLKQSKSGREKLDLPRIDKMTEQQKQLIMKYGKKGGTFGTVKKEREKARKNYYERYGSDAPEPTNEQLRDIANRNNDIHEFIQEHSDAIYKVSELYDAVHAPRRLTYGEADKLLNMFNNPEYYDKKGKFVGNNFEGDVSTMREAQGSVNPFE